jgi:hypothetical protein
MIIANAIECHCVDVFKYNMLLYQSSVEFLNLLAKLRKIFVSLHSETEFFHETNEKEIFTGVYGRYPYVGSCEMGVS